MLKQLWDYIFLVRTSIDEWKTTPWKVILGNLNFLLCHNLIFIYLPWQPKFHLNGATSHFSITLVFKDIDVENMDMECKKFSKDIRGLDKEMRTWDAFNGLEVTVKNMLTSLRAVGELQASVYSPVQKP